MEVEKGKDHAYHFTGKGAPGSAGGAHVEGADEKVVQKDIDYAGNGNEGHRGFCISHAPEKPLTVLYSTMRGTPAKQMVR